MGCASSSSSSGAASGNNRPSRPANTTTVPVHRSGALARPLIATRNYRHGSQITQRDLQNMRDNFWSSRTEGSPQMWHNIRSVAEALASGDVVLANAILEASNIVSPTGTMDTLYDERGVQYKVPIYCCANPVELVGESASSSNSPASPGGPAASSNEPGAVKVSSSKAPEGSALNLRIRINPGDINLAVKTYSGHTIADLKRSIVEQARQAPPPMPEIREDRQRIMYLGRELQNAQRLADAGIDEQKVVQVFLRPAK